MQTIRENRQQNTPVRVNPLKRIHGLPADERVRAAGELNQAWNCRQRIAAQIQEGPGGGGEPFIIRVDSDMNHGLSVDNFYEPGFERAIPRGDHRQQRWHGVRPNRADGRHTFSLFRGTGCHAHIQAAIEPLLQGFALIRRLPGPDEKKREAAKEEEGEQDQNEPQAFRETEFNGRRRENREELRKDASGK